MSEDGLKAIEARCADETQRCTRTSFASNMNYRLLHADIPALIAEVRRLQALMGKAILFNAALRAKTLEEASEIAQKYGQKMDLDKTGSGWQGFDIAAAIRALARQLP